MRALLVIRPRPPAGEYSSAPISVEIDLSVRTRGDGAAVAVFIFINRAGFAIFSGDVAAGCGATAFDIIFESVAGVDFALIHRRCAAHAGFAVGNITFGVGFSFGIIITEALCALALDVNGIIGAVFVGIRLIAFRTGQLKAFVLTKFGQGIAFFIKR